MKKVDVSDAVSVQKIAVKNIRVPVFMAREKIERAGLDDLAQSIKEQGLINPITIKAVKGGYEVVAGHRRFLACKKLGMKEIFCMVRTGNTQENELLKFAENMRREDLSDVEEARSLKHIIQVTGFKPDKIAKMINRSTDYVKQKLTVLEYPDYLFNALAEHKISFSAARELARISDKDVQKEYVRHAVISGITPSVAKQWADDWIESQKNNKKDFNDAGNAGTDGSYIETKLPCNICYEDVKASESVMWRICNKCRKEMVK